MKDGLLSFITHHSAFTVSLILPFRPALLHEGFDAFLRVLGLHQLVEVEVFDAGERFEEGPAARRVRRPARHLQRGRGQLAQARENLLQLRFELVAPDDVADEAEALRLARVEDFARQQKLARPALAYEPGQQHRRHGRENSELYLRLPELRAR